MSDGRTPIARPSVPCKYVFRALLHSIVPFWRRGSDCRLSGLTSVPYRGVSDHCPSGLCPFYETWCTQASQGTQRFSCEVSKARSPPLEDGYPGTRRSGRRLATFLNALLWVLFCMQLLLASGGSAPVTTRFWVSWHTVSHRFGPSS